MKLLFSYLKQYWKLVALALVLAAMAGPGLFANVAPMWLAFALGFSLLLSAAVTYKKVIFLKTYLGMQPAPARD